MASTNLDIYHWRDECRILGVYYNNREPAARGGLFTQLLIIIIQSLFTVRASK